MKTGEKTSSSLALFSALALLLLFPWPRLMFLASAIGMVAALTSGADKMNRSTQLLLAALAFGLAIAAALMLGQWPFP